MSIDDIRTSILFKEGKIERLKLLKNQLNRTLADNLYVDTLILAQMVTLVTNIILEEDSCRELNIAKKELILVKDKVKKGKLKKFKFPKDWGKVDGKKF